MKHLFLTEALEQTTLSYEGAWLKMLLTLGGLLALVLITLVALRKFSLGRLGKIGTQKKITIIEKKPISPKTLLYLVEVEGKKFLFAESQAEIRPIATISPIEEDDFR